MKRYANLNGQSGVVAYALQPDGIRVKFRNSTTYTYRHASAGAPAVAAMQALAQAGLGLGLGLATFIGQHQPPYACRVD